MCVEKIPGVNDELNFHEIQVKQSFFYFMHLVVVKTEFVHLWLGS